MAWEQIAAEFRSYLSSKIPVEWRLSSVPTPDEQPDITGTYLHQYLTPAEITITETPFPQLLAQLRAGEATSYDVTRAFCHRSALAHQFLSCLLEINYDAALAEAAALDRKREAGAELTLLHGLPVSLKDQFVVEGLETCMGYVGWRGNKVGGKDLGESELVRILRAQGAVVFCKTSVPQSLMSGETYNNLVGFCMNPRNRRLTSGGSSGGEGSLLAAGGSPLGVGTDIGGSVRIPASYSGIYSLKPSTGRFPYKGMLNSLDGQSAMPSALGPMSPSLDALLLFAQAVVASSPWRRDPLCVRLPWTPFTPRPLKIGFHPHNGFVTPWPPLARALTKLASALSAAGHTLLPWSPPSHARSVAITGSIFRADGGHDVHNVLELTGEPCIPQLREFLTNPPQPAVSLHEWFELMLRRRKYQEEYAEYWDATEADVVLTAATPTAAVEFKGYREHGYTSVFNNLDLPAVVMPVSRIGKGEEGYPEGWEPASNIDKEVMEMWDPEKFVGMPIAVQIVARRHEEEKVLGVAKMVDEVIEAAGLRG